MLPLLICLLAPEPDPILSCYDTQNLVSHVIECQTTVQVWSGTELIAAAPYYSTFTNTGFPSSRYYLLEEGSSDGFEDCVTLTP
jgi:hypothetical protein